MSISKGKKPLDVSPVPKPGYVQHLQAPDLRRSRAPEYVPAAGATLATEEDILLCWDGSAGLSAMGMDGAAGSTIAVLRVTDPEFDPRYVGRFLEANAELLKRTATGATIPHVDRRTLEGLQLPKVSLAEQRRIADLIDKADAIRRKRKEAIVVTEDLLRSAFLEMVGPAAKDFAKWPVKTVESLSAQVPNAMRSGPFGSDLLHSEFVDEGIAVLGIDNAVQNRFAWGERRFITREKYEGLRRYTVRRGDVIVTIMGTTGRSAVVPDDIPTAITTKHLATITLDREQAEPEFVSQALHRHPEVLHQIAAANRGAIMSGLNLGLIKRLRIPVPPIEPQREFTKLTLRARSLTARMVLNEGIEDLFNALVSRAFSRAPEAV